MQQYNKTIQKCLILIYITKEAIKGHNPNWPQIAHHPYKTLSTGSSGSGKTYALLNLVHYHPDTDKNYLFGKD